MCPRAAKHILAHPTPPQLSDEIRISLAEHYIQLYNILLGKEFIPESGDVEERVINNLKKYGYRI